MRRKTNAHKSNMFFKVRSKVGRKNVMNLFLMSLIISSLLINSDILSVYNTGNSSGLSSINKGNNSAGSKIALGLNPYFSDDPINARIQEIFFDKGIYTSLIDSENELQPLSSSNILEFKVSTPEINVKNISMPNGENAHRLDIDGGNYLNQKGNPRLPFKTLSILLPFGMTMEEVGIKIEKQHILDIQYKIEPAQEQNKYLNDVNILNENKLIYDMLVYESFNPFPGRYISVEGINEFRGYKILTLNIYPIQYIPSIGKISYFEDIYVYLSLKNDNQLSKLLRGIEEDKMRAISLIDNPELINTYAKEVQAPLLSSQDSYDYVIITNEELKNSLGLYTFQDLAAFKNSRGIKTIIVTVEDIYSNYTGIDNQEKIRNFIIDAYNDWGIEYVLLGGDGDGSDVGGESEQAIVPSRGFYCSEPGETDTNIPSDLYYGALDGSWNDDGDIYWGEPGEEDLYAEVYVGRAPVDSEEELSNFIMKTLAHETTSNPYLDNALMIGEDLGWSIWGGDYKDEIKDGSSSHGYYTAGIPTDISVSTLYDRDATWDENDLMTLLNNDEIHTINHLGHSNVDSMMKLNNDDVDTLLTNDNYFFIYSQGCYGASFDNRDSYNYYKNYDSIAEHLVTTPNGAFAMIGNSRYGWGDYYTTDGASQHYDREFFDAIYREEIEEIGIALQDSKEDCIGFISQDCMRWVYYTLNLLGDPTASLFKKPNDYAPVLSGAKVTPKSGYPITPFNFSILYSDADNNAPKYIELNLNGTEYQMEKVNVLDENYVDGCLYSCSVELESSPFNYSYYFSCRDSKFMVETEVKNDLKVTYYNNIIIDDLSDTNWIWAKNSGLCKGTGTEQDPYIISNIDFKSLENSTCLIIQNSKVYFEIKNCSFQDALNENTGLKLINVSSGFIINNIVFNNFNGIELVNCTNIVVSENNIIDNLNIGLELLECNYTSISKNNISRNGYYGIECRDGHNSVQQNNYISFNGGGIILDNTENSTLIENTIYNNSLWGIIVFVSHYSKIIKNNIKKYQRTGGICLVGVWYSKIEENIIENFWSQGSEGIYIVNNRYNVFSNNIIRSFGFGIAIRDGVSGKYNTFNGNIIENSHWYGIEIEYYNSGNLFYNNYFRNSAIAHVNDMSFNYWNNSVIGNYWDDYTGVDKVAPFEIGDTPYEGSETHPMNQPIDYLPIYISPYQYYSDITIDDRPLRTNWNWARNKGICYGLGTQESPYTIRNIQFTSSISGSSALTIKNSDAYFKIVNCTFTHSMWDSYGLRLTSVINGYIYNNTFSGNDITYYGILNEASSFNIYENNIVRDYRFDGMQIRQFDTVSSDHNKILNNKFINLFYAIDCTSNINNSIYYNYFFDNLYSIDLNYEQNCIIANNYFNNNERDAIELRNCNTVNIFNNSLNHNQDYGRIDVTSCKNINIFNNYLNDNIGIRVSYSENITFCKNYIVNQYEIFYASDCVNVNIFDNHVDMNKGRISISDCQFVSITNNTGFEIISGSSPSEHIIINNNDGYGIKVMGNWIDILNNIITDNKGNGVILSNSNSFTIINNTIRNNYDDDLDSAGIKVFNCFNGIISNNIIEHNILSGIVVGDSEMMFIYDNYIHNNSGTGIVLNENSYNNLIYNNFFTRNGLKNAIDDGLNNDWNNSIIGNYYDDYWGIDEKSPFGIGDTPYKIYGPGYSMDFLPICTNSIQKNEYNNILIDDSPGSTYDWEWAIFQLICTGNGTLENPYIIENKIFNALEDGSPLTIKNTNANFIIRNCSFYNSTVSYAGLEMINVSNGIIINNHFQENYHGILINSGTNHSIKKNLMTKNFGMGISLIECNNSLILENELTFNELNGIGLEYCMNNSIIENQILFNGLNGILLDLCTDHLIKNNDLNNNIRCGIIGQTCYDIEIINNSITENTISGIRLDTNSKNNTIARNLVSKNMERGIHIDDCFDTIIFNNTITFNKYTGIYVYDQSFNTKSYNTIISCNFISNPETTGISLYSKNSTIINNVFFNNSDGLHVSSSNNEIFNNLFLENTGNGIYMSGSFSIIVDDNIIKLNEFRNNLGSGITLIGVHENLIYSNIIYNNSGTGISGSYFSPSNNNTIFDNVIHFNNYGMFVKGHYNNISYNDIQYNNWAGLISYESNYLEIIGNNISHNYHGIVFRYGNNNSIISNNEISFNKEFGIFTEDANRLRIYNNYIHHHEKLGIYLTVLFDPYSDTHHSVNCTVSKNTISHCYSGIVTHNDCENINIIENFITCNLKSGIGLWGGSNAIKVVSNQISYNNESGILIYDTTNSIISYNNITNNLESGLYLDSTSTDNIINDNLIKENEQYGVFIEDERSQNNTFNRNYFIDNFYLHAFDVEPNNYWNNSQIGNFWDNYTGVDRGDGIGNIPFVSGNVVDYLPIVFGDNPPFPPGTFVLSTDAAPIENDGTFTLNWDISTYTDNYSVFVSNSEITAIDSSCTEIASGLKILYHDITDLSTDEYYYVVVAYNTFGETKSNCIHITVHRIPTSFELTTDADDPDDDGTFTLNWDISTYADNYSVYVSNSEITAIDLSCTEIASDLEILYHDITDLPTGEYYYYVVVAYNEFGEMMSNCVHITVHRIPTSIELTTDAENPDVDSTFYLNWTVSTYATNYSIYTSNTTITEYRDNLTLIAQGLTNQSYFVNVSTNGIYYYIVIAYNEYGNATSNCIDILVDDPTNIPPNGDNDDDDDDDPPDDNTIPGFIYIIIILILLGLISIPCILKKRTI